MPISTQNAGGVVAGGHSAGVGETWIRMLKKTRVASISRDADKGETVKVSVDDARFLVGYNYAEGVKAPEAKKVAEPTPEPEVEESSSSSAEVVETESSAGEPQRFFGRGRRRGGK